MKAFVLICGLIFMFASPALMSGQSAAGQSGAPAANAPASVPVKLQMRNVDFHFTDHIVAHIAALDGTMSPIGGTMPIFDDKNSFGLDVDSADITITMAALASDMNEFVFAVPGSPIKDLKIKTDDGKLSLSGVLKKKGEVPFEITSSVSLTPEGTIRLHTEKVRALHLPVKGLMDLLGLDTADLINTKRIPGVATDKDDLILDPQKIFPPPELRGHVIAVRVIDSAMVLTFGTPGQPAQHLRATNVCGGRNFLSFRGGPIRFGKLEMDQSDMELSNIGTAASFDFSLDGYKDQLVAGYSKVTQRGGLCVHMPEYYAIKRPAAGGVSAETKK
ncbi:MAG TPA: hypothetical protein VIH72_16855 [Candidatus Acidoferrales bacterium]